MKKLFLSLSLLCSSCAFANVCLDIKWDKQETSQQEVRNKSINTVQELDENNHFSYTEDAFILEGDAATIDEESVTMNFKVYETFDAQKEAVLIAEPVLVMRWNEPATVTVRNSNNDTNEESSFTLSITPSNR